MEEPAQCLSRFFVPNSEGSKGFYGTFSIQQVIFPAYVLAHSLADRTLYRAYSK